MRSRETEVIAASVMALWEMQRGQMLESSFAFMLKSTLLTLRMLIYSRGKEEAGFSICAFIVRIVQR